MGAATEPTTMTDMFLKATEGNGLENSYETFLEVEKYQCIEMETLWRNTVGLLPFLWQRGIFWLCAEREFVLSPVRSILGRGGSWDVKGTSLESWELSLECWQPEYIPHQGTVRYLFSSFLSPTHSFQMRPIGALVESAWDSSVVTPNGPGHPSQGEVAQRCETWEEKESCIKVINESKSAFCKGAGSRGNLSVWYAGATRILAPFSAREEKGT